MEHTPVRGTLLDLPLIEERYGRAFVASITLHGLFLAFLLLAPFLVPKSTPITIGTGPGGGTGGESYAVGVADDLGGGAGLIKPATSPVPPAPPIEKPAKKEVKKEADTKAIPIPDDVSKNRKKTAEPPSAKSAKPVPVPAAGVIPVAGEKGAGGAGGMSGGSGGGIGGGSGVSIGSGTGGLFDSWYAQSVERRVSSNWSKPIGVQQRIEIVYSFMVDARGRISEIKKEKSSGNDDLDRTAERAILASNPLLEPPPALRGQPLQFICQFVYPPDK